MAAVGHSRALFCVSLGAALYNNMQMHHEIAQMREADPLMQTNFVALAPAKDAPADAKAMVAWQPDKQSGVIHIKGLPAAGKEKIISSGSSMRSTRIRSTPAWSMSSRMELRRSASDLPTQAHQVKAFALSLEREGGVPKREGPILLIGNA